MLFSLSLKLKKLFRFKFTGTINKRGSYKNRSTKYFYYIWSSAWLQEKQPSESRFTCSIVRSRVKKYIYPRLFSDFPRGDRNKRLKSVQDASSRFHDGFTANSLTADIFFFPWKEETHTFHSETSRKKERPLRSYRCWRNSRNYEHSLTACIFESFYFSKILKHAEITNGMLETYFINSSEEFFYNFFFFLFLCESKIFYNYKCHVF